MARLRRHCHTGLAFVFAIAVFGLLVSRATVGGPGDVVIAFPTTFSSWDGSPQDLDGISNGVFTVQGNLTITKGGSITCSDDLPLPPSGDGCPIQLEVIGNVTIERGGSIYAENRRGGGGGGDIAITVGGDFSMHGAKGRSGGGIISTSKLGTGDTGGGGDVTIHVTGDVSVEAGAEILANANGEAGKIEMRGRAVGIDGLLSSRANTDSGRGGPISIVSECDLMVNDSGVISSRGQGPGADLVRLEGCVVTIYGLIESTGHGHQNAAGGKLCNANSIACVEVSGRAVLTIDSRPPHNGELNIDTALSGGNAGWAQLVSTGDIFVFGDISGPFAVHANQPNVTNGHGGQIFVSSGWNITATDLAFQADAVKAGGDGGRVDLQGGENVSLGGASITARGDFNASGGFGTGGRIEVFSNSRLSWQSGVADVRPTGTVVNPEQRGSIVLSGCGDFVSPSFPSLGAVTSPVNQSIIQMGCNFPHPPPESCCGRPTPGPPPPTFTPNLTNTITPTGTSTPNIRVIRFRENAPTPTPGMPLRRPAAF